MYSEIYVKPNIKEQFDSKYLSDLKLDKENFDGEKYTYPGDVAEFLYEDELDREFKSWLFCDFGSDFYQMDSNDGEFIFDNAEEEHHGNNIKASGDLSQMFYAYRRCIEYCQELSHMESFAQRNFYRALEEEELFDKYDIVVIRHFN